MLAVLDASVMGWLGALEGWQAGLTTFGGLVGTVLGIVWPIVRNYRKQRAAAMEAADHPVAPAALPPVDLHALAKQVAEMAAWTLDDARAEVRRLQAENAELKRDYESAVERIQQLERAIISADTRAARAIDELRDHKRATTSGVSTRASNITPLRPPKSG